MMLPLPRTIASLLEHDAPSTNRSLVFDRLFDKYRASRSGLEKLKPEDKPAFFDSFVSKFVCADYSEFTARHWQALSGAGAHHVDATLQSRLAIGLGLPHPTETGLLLDRLSGAPLIPGSTTKGLLRRTCELIVRGELEAPPELQTLAEEGDTLFGDQAAKGALVCYDAFPTVWPVLAVDIMTPHHSKYYMDGGIPGDWENPVPVSFLTVEKGSQFRFWFSVRRGIGNVAGLAISDFFGRIETLLGIGLDWLAVGGKKSSGYGFMTVGGAHAEPPLAILRELKPGEVVEVLVRSDRTKTDRPRFDLQATGHVGVLEPKSYAAFDNLPEEKRAAGSRLRLVVKAGGNTPQLGYLDPDAPPVAKAPKLRGSPKRK